MAVDGIWTTELLGLFGWETTGILVLDNGRVIGGGNHHYSVGKYQSNGEDVTFSVSVEFHGTPRPIFGATDRSLSVEGNLRVDGEVMEGTIYRADKPDQTVAYRLTKRSEIP